MTDTPPAASPWLKRAFAASLALNLFLVGVIGGHTLFSAQDETAKRPNAPRGYSLYPRVMREALPEEQHEAIRAFFKDARNDMQQGWRNITTLRREIDAALRATPFDIDALRAAQQREVEARAAMRTAYNESNSAFLATLTDEERAKIADVALSNMEKQIEYWRERRRQREAARQGE